MSLRNYSYMSLFIISALILFLELLVIRIISTEISIFAYLQNCILVVCLLGLGMGCAKRGQREVPVEIGLIGLLIIISCLLIPATSSFLLSLGYSLSGLHDFVVWNQDASNNVYTIAPLVILGTVGTFIILYFIWALFFSLGVELGIEFNNAKRPLLAYTVNIVGSLIGVWLFSSLCFFSFPIFLWFIVLLLLWLPLLLPLSNKKNISRFLLLSALILVAFGLDYEKGVIEKKWSPYQKLEVVPGKRSDEPIVLVNNYTFQQMMNNSEDSSQKKIEAGASDLRGLHQYDLPYRLRPDAKNILIVGAGTGNDVAGALRNTNAKVTAVEIDPVVYDLGKRYHAEKPYDNPRVRTVNDDARAFFNQSKEKFDIIVFGLLDSHTTPALTNARLDNFVYTKESLSAAKNLLKEDGVIVLIFLPQRDYILDRLANTLHQVIGKKPFVFFSEASEFAWGGYLLVAGESKEFEHLLANNVEFRNYISEGENKAAKSLTGTVSPTSDDWPYLYIRDKGIPTLFYLVGFILLCLFFLARKRIGDDSSYADSLTVYWWPFVALGVGFSIVETYGINQLSLLFGSTWIVNSVVISAVLIMILAANAIVVLFPRVSGTLALVCNIFSLLVLYQMNFSSLNTFSFIYKSLIGGMLVSLPLFFSGILFARYFSLTENRGKALGMNLLGALIGGMLQLASFAVGIANLLIIAAFFYGSLFLCLYDREKVV